ncbi:hypothetical protein B0H67DRAFT_559014 [Lasiosphaeris hirsuta]|uniref:Zn(2)-C6 fungal-type domain-containing protein n=1 Tax=Lasiosphaeris hirsuta TaxID=260670 RepID=A0AA40B8E5_9PEZI|nr:hypothetical protein B0H67DRAFT_559014 [Lasiosphaeris hirsuta]
MPPSTAPRQLGLASDQRARSRKTHRKSRNGCANCKLRRVKCDEAKPQCCKCTSYGVGCNYEPGASEMQLAVSGAFKVNLDLRRPVPRCLPQTPIRLPLAGRDDQTYELTLGDRELLINFTNSNILPVGSGANCFDFQSKAIKLAQVNPYLLHIVLTLSHLYHIHVNGNQMGPKVTSALAFHWYQGTALFNAKLSQPIKDEDKDPLWAAAALLGSSAFADIRATSYAEAWPLARSSPLDLSWMKMTGGKRAVFEITEPQRPSSIFHPILIGPRHNLPPTPRVGDEVLALPPRFIQMFNLDEHSTPENNPYHAAATVLAQIIIAAESGPAGKAKYLCFLGYADPRYLNLLAEKDPGAMLLLMYWYAIVMPTQEWWIWRRAIFEGPAICSVLETRFAEDPRLLELLEYPKAVFAAAATTVPYGASR